MHAKVLMIISHKHKFIFIKNRKTASTSVEISLSKYCGPNDIITPITLEDENVKRSLGLPGAQNYLKPRNEWSFKQWRDYLNKGKKPKKFYHHISSAEIIKLVPDEVWNSYFKFTLERNPFDKVVSFYYWRKANEKYEKVSDFILDGGLDPILSYGMYSTNETPVVDKIYQYEDLDFFEKDISKRFNFQEPFQLVGYKAKSQSRKIKDYRKVLDDKAVELIKLAFEKEIKLFGYEF